MDGSRAHSKGRIDRERIRGTTEADMEQQKAEDQHPRPGQLGPVRFPNANANVSELRETWYFAGGVCRAFRSFAAHRAAMGAKTARSGRTGEPSASSHRRQS
jgi:hypothetical protein